MTVVSTPWRTEATCRAICAPMAVRGLPVRQVAKRHDAVADEGIDHLRSTILDVSQVIGGRHTQARGEGGRPGRELARPGGSPPGGREGAPRYGNRQHGEEQRVHNAVDDAKPQDVPHESHTTRSRGEAGIRCTLATRMAPTTTSRSHPRSNDGAGTSGDRPRSSGCSRTGMTRQGARRWQRTSHAATRGNRKRARSSRIQGSRPRAPRRTRCEATGLGDLDISEGAIT